VPSLRSIKCTAPSYQGSLHHSGIPPVECTLWDTNPLYFECAHTDMCVLVSPDSTFPHFLHSVPKFHFFLQFLVGKGIPKQSHSTHCHSPHHVPHISRTMVSCANSSAHSLAKLSGSRFWTCPSKMEVCPVLSFFTKFINYAARHIIIVLYHSPINTINLCSKAYRCNTLTQPKWVYKRYMCSKNTLNWPWADMKQSNVSCNFIQLVLLYKIIVCLYVHNA